MKGDGKDENLVDDGDGDGDGTRVGSIPVGVFKFETLFGCIATV
jgi:hypothetical protein